MLGMAFIGLLFFHFETVSYFGGGIENSNYYTLLISSLLFSFLVLPLVNNRLRIGYGDVAVFALILYFLGNSYFTHSFDSVEFRMAVSYFLLYFCFVIVSAKYPRFCDFATIVILLAGISQSGLVLSQLYGFELSNHHRFAVTGSFFNPGPCGIFLSGVFVLAVSVVKGCQLSLQDKFNYFKGGVAYVALFATLLAIVPTMSRAGWVGAIVGVAYLYHPMIDIVAQKMKLSRRKILMILGFGVLLLFTAIYFLKRDSANGRLFIWENTVSAFKESPLFGVGVANFAEVYSEQQYRYFVTADALENDNMNIVIAGVPTYAFNEPLSITLLLGLIGLLFVGYIVYCKLSYRVSAVIVALLCASLFSYPFYVAPIAIVFLVAMACQREKSSFLTSAKIVLPCFLVVIVMGVMVNKDLKKELEIEKKWRSASIYYSMKDYESTVEDYEKLLPSLRSNYKFLFEYGHSLNKIGRYEQSNTVLVEGAKKSVDPMYWSVIGNNCLELGDYAACEKAYLKD